MGAPGVTVEAAARALGVWPRTVNKWIDRGAPTISRGGRGRSSSRVDVQALEAWRRDRAVPAALPPQPGHEYTQVAQRVITKVMIERYRKRPSRQHAAETVALWFELASALNAAAGCGEVDDIPEEIRSLERAGLGPFGAI